MADPSTSQTAFADQLKSKPSDVDLEKGPDRSSSDIEAETVVPSGDDTPPGEKPSESAAEDDGDPNIVSWDGPDDPANPMNWEMRKKWTNVAVLSILTIIT